MGGEEGNPGEDDEGRRGKNTSESPAKIPRHSVAFLLKTPVVLLKKQASFWESLVATLPRQERGGKWSDLPKAIAICSRKKGGGGIAKWGVFV